MATCEVRGNGYDDHCCAHARCAHGAGASAVSDRV